jgi:hypothetical protein
VLDIKAGYLNNAKAGGDDEYRWINGRPVIVAGRNFTRDTDAAGTDVKINDPAAGTDVYYPLDGGETDPRRFDYVRKTYAQPDDVNTMAYIDMNLQDANFRASYASDFTHFQTLAGKGYTLADGMTLKLKIDGGAEQTVTFKAADFTAIASAKTDEIVADINKVIGGLARKLEFNRDGVASQVCLRAANSIEITGGTALGALGFAVEKVTRNHTRFIGDISDGTTPGSLPNKLEYEMYFRGDTDYFRSDALNPVPPADTLGLIGAASIDGNGTFGATDRQPISLVNVGLHETTKDKAGVRGIIHSDTAAHELAHSWMQVGVNLKAFGPNPFHATHTGFALVNGKVVYNDTVVTATPNHPSVWSNLQNNESMSIDPWEARQLRNSMFRTWTGTATRDKRD